MKVKFRHYYKTLLQSPLQSIALRFRKTYQKSWALEVWSERLDSRFLDPGLVDSRRWDIWTLDDWTLGL